MAELIAFLGGGVNETDLSYWFFYDEPECPESLIK